METKNHTPEYTYMEEEIDLREYVYVLLRYWKWIAGVTLITTIVAVFISLLLPKKYTATASVVITTPRYRVNFDPNFETIDVKQNYGAYLELAKSDTVIADLVARLGDELPHEQQNIFSVRGMLDAQTGDDRSFIKLSATSDTPDEAASFANVWAEVLIQYANALYSQDEQNLVFFQKELQKADQELSLAEKDLLDFQRRNRINVLQNQISSKDAAISEYLRVIENGRMSTLNEPIKMEVQLFSAYLEMRKNLPLLIQDAHTLRNRLQLQDNAEDDFPLASTLTALLTELDSISSKGTGSGFQLQVPVSEISVVTQDRETLLTYLDDLITSLESKNTEVNQAINEISQQLLILGEDELPPGLELSEDDYVPRSVQQTVQEVQILQEALQQQQMELDRLQFQHELAQETYKTVARKVEESKLTASGQEEEARLASLAAAPKNPSAPQKKMIVAAAGALSLFTSIFGAFLWEWWRNAEIEVVT